MKYVNLHTHSANITVDTISICNQYPRFYVENHSIYSIGIHPWHINLEFIEEELSIISNKIFDKNCLAIGECGLDKRIEIDFEIQIDVFKKQLLLAKQFNKPVIVHCVAAFDELIAIKQQFNLSMPIIVHGFSKNEKIAEILLKNGFHLSIGKHLMQNSDFESVLKSIPVEKLFLETDSADFDIKTIYEKAASALKINIYNLQTKIFKNFNNVFKP